MWYGAVRNLTFPLTHSSHQENVICDILTYFVYIYCTLFYLKFKFIQEKENIYIINFLKFRVVDTPSSNVDTKFRTSTETFKIFSSYVIEILGVHIQDRLSASYVLVELCTRYLV